MSIEKTNTFPSHIHIQKYITDAFRNNKRLDKNKIK